MKTYLTLIKVSAIALFLFSCSTPLERASRKIDRLVERFPSLKVADTAKTVIYDTIEIESIKFDTSFVLKFDTIRINKKGATVTLFRDVHDTMYLDVECPPDTIYYRKEVKIPCDDKIVVETKKELGNLIIYVLIGFGLFAFLAFLFRK